MLQRSGKFAALENTFAPLGLLQRFHGSVSKGCRQHSRYRECCRAVHHHQGRIDVYTVIVKVIAAVITISTGGSLGQEGPSAQIGSAYQCFATGFRLNDIDRRKLVVCGVSAGMASFGAPVAGAVFGLEVLYVGQVFYDVLLPCIVSGIVSYQVSLNLGMAYIYQPLCIFLK